MPPQVIMQMIRILQLKLLKLMRVVPPQAIKQMIRMQLQLKILKLMRRVRKMRRKRKSASGAVARKKNNI